MSINYLKTSTVLILCAMASAIASADEHWLPLGKRVRYPLYIKGTYSEGSNVTEPRPQESEYLKVRYGGIILVKQGAGFYLSTLVKKTPEKTLYIKIEYENPKDESNPLVNDMVFTPDYGGFNFSSPDVVRDIVGYHDYLITISIYENKNSDSPIDVLKQKVRAYVDTQTPEPLIFYRMRPRE